MIRRHPQPRDFIAVRLAHLTAQLITLEIRGESTIFGLVGAHFSWFRFSLFLFRLISTLPTKPKRDDLRSRRHSHAQIDINSALWK
jgi:hypothetical protein